MFTSALFNGTTLNGSGGADTLNDSKTYRAFGTGHTILRPDHSPD